MKKYLLGLCVLLLVIVVYQNIKIRQNTIQINELFTVKDSLKNLIKENNFPRRDFSAVLAKNNGNAQNKLVLAYQCAWNMNDFKLKLVQKAHPNSPKIDPLLIDTILDVKLDEDNLYYFDIDNKYFINNVVYAVLKTELDSTKYSEKLLEIRK